MAKVLFPHDQHAKSAWCQRKHRQNGALSFLAIGVCILKVFDVSQNFLAIHFLVVVAPSAKHRI